MGGRGIRLSRRTVLTGLGASIVDTAFADGSLDVQGTEDGGFVVFANFREAWKVDGADIKQSWGSATTTISAAGASPSVAVSGSLFGKTAKLDFSFRPRTVGWECRRSINLQDLGKFEASASFPFVGAPDAPVFSIPIQAARWRQAVGLPPGTAMLHPRLEITRNTLAPALSGPFVFEAVGLRSRRSLQLLADGKASSRLTFGPSETLKLAAGWSLDTEGMSASFPAGRSDYLVLEGEGVLQIGATRFAADKKSSVRFARNGTHSLSWTIDWRLPHYEHAVDTPHGQFIIAGGDSSNIAAQGNSRSLQSFLGSAQLRHAAFRLPLESKGQFYADLGRLDFDNADKSRISFKLARFGKPPEGSWITLDFDDPDPFHIQLDSARLHVAQQADLFRGCFRFTGIALGQNKTGLLLRRSPSNEAKDCLLRVDLPPQHVKEESFARQLPVLPGDELDPEDLPALFDADRRKKLQDKLSKTFKDKQDTSFNEFATQYRVKYENYVKSYQAAKADKSKTPPPIPPIAIPSEATCKLEEIYVGPDGFFSVLSRRLANGLAYEIWQQIISKSQLKIDDLALGLDPITVGDILGRHPQPLSQKEWTIETAKSAFNELLAEAEKRSDDQALIQTWYRKLNPGAGPFYVKAWLDNWPKEVPDYSNGGKLPAPNMRGRLQALLVAMKSGAANSTVADNAQKLLNEAYQDEAPKKLPVRRQSAGRLASCSIWAPKTTTGPTV